MSTTSAPANTQPSSSSTTPPSSPSTQNSTQNTTITPSASFDSLAAFLASDPEARAAHRDIPPLIASAQHQAHFQTPAPVASNQNDQKGRVRFDLTDKFHFVEPRDSMSHSSTFSYDATDPDFEDMPPGFPYDTWWGTWQFVKEYFNALGKLVFELMDSVGTASGRGGCPNCDGNNCSGGNHQ